MHGAWRSGSWRGWRGLALAGSGLLVSHAAAAPGPVMPHPAPLPRGRASANAACEGCHADIAAEWRESLHHASFTDATIQAALPRDAETFCRDCHAPESDPAVGVGCVTCHVTTRDGRTVLTGPSSSRSAPSSAVAPHPLLRSADFAGDGACASCHEFDFPDRRSRRAPLAMQRTVSEHRDHLEATGAGDTCLTCHMTPRAGHLDHRFAAARDETFVRSAVSIHARRVAPDKVEIVLSPARVGHAFPTGDVFRRLRITAGTRQRFLARHYGTQQELPGIVTRVETGDDRVQGGPQVVELSVPATPTLVQVIYERAEGPSEADRSTASVAGAIELFRAEL